MARERLWPVHPKPLPDELLSSWLVRLSHASGMKAQTFARVVFGEDSLWIRDIDRNPPYWLVDELCKHAGVDRIAIYQTTMWFYIGRLFDDFRISGHQKWVLVADHLGMTPRDHAQQFCPECLANDSIPYMRKQWRIALFTYCPEHRIELHDACPECGRPIANYRGDFGRELDNTLPLHACNTCGFDLREAERRPVVFPSRELQEIFDEMLLSLDGPKGEAGRFDVELFDVMHQLTKAMGTKSNQGKLLRFLLERVGLPEMPMPAGWMTIEERRRDERHVWLLCVLWLMLDLEYRLEEAWLERVVLYRELVKDFEWGPDWFFEITEGLSYRRKI